MAQHDYVIANGTGAAVRSDLNNALAAIVSQNSGATEPATTYAFQFWADTTTGTLKLRNSANSAWIELLQLDGTLTMEDGTEALPGLSFRNDLDTGLWRPGTNQLAISTNAVERVEFGASEVVFNDGGANYDFRVEGDTNANLLFVDASADAVGIGTSSPATNRLLHIQQSGFTAARIQSTANYAQFELFGTGGNNYISSDQGLIIQSNSTAAITIDSSQRVGIGTTSPADALGYGTAVDIRGSGTGNGGVVYVRNSDASVTGFVAAYGDGRMDVGTSTNHPLKFITNSNERCRVDTSGRLLVGTSSSRSPAIWTSPLLQVESTSYTSSSISVINNQNADAEPALTFGKSRGTSVGSNTAVTSGDIIGNINFQGADGSGLIRAAQIFCAIDGTPGASDMPGRLVFSTTADGASSPTERMRINSNGQLCINTTTATTGIGHRVFIEDGTTYAPMGVNNAAGGTGSSNNIVIYRAGSQVGSITTTNTATAYNTSSDYRLKENITEVTDGIARLQQLKPSRFNFIGDAERTVDGFIAHEVQDVVPEAVHGAKDEVDADGKPIYQGIDQSKLVPLLTAALQEAIGEIESLKARVAALESA